MSLDYSYLRLGAELIDYEMAWEWQRRVHADVVAGRRGDTVLLLEHAPVYTAGRRTEPHERPADGTPVIDVDRGGKITWHGPGQLVGYPIVTLPEPVKVVDYVRRLEEAMIRTFADLGLRTGRVEGRSGVWLAAEPGGPGAPRPERKVAAIGVRVAQQVTMHGFAINVDPDLAAYDRIVPCGIADAGVSSLAAELDEVLALTTVAHRLTPHLSELLSFAPYDRSPDIVRAAVPGEPFPADPVSVGQVRYGLGVGVYAGTTTRAKGPCAHVTTAHLLDDRFARIRVSMPALPRHAAGGDGPAVEIRQLRKTYRTRKGRHHAVAGLDLTVPRGGVHGFLGPNGSGKTTTIRMLLGLIRADGGTMSVFGHRVPEQLPQVIGSIGAIVEQPKFFPAFSGRRNLALLAEGIGAPPTRVDQVLTEVGLAERGRDRFKTYSLGMRQRLAIAATLLKEPDLLIFDEPTNGLDPAGIHEIRASMTSLARQGRTVLVSSHILAEVQQVADTVSIIGRGRLLAEGPVETILARGTSESVRVRVADGERAAGLLAAAGYRVQPGPDRTLLAQPPERTAEDGSGPFDPAHVTATLAREGLYVSELTPVRADLEQVFLSLTAAEHLGSAPPPAEPFGDVEQLQYRPQPGPQAGRR